METSTISISTPELKDLKEAAVAKSFERDDVEGIRERYVEAFLAAVEKGKEAEEVRKDLVSRFEHHMAMGLGVPGMRIRGGKTHETRGRR